MNICPQHNETSFLLILVDLEMEASQKLAKTSLKFKPKLNIAFKCF